MADVYQEIVRLNKSGEEAVLVTVVAKEGHGPAQLQAKMLITADDRRLGTVGGGALEKMAIAKAAQVLQSRRAVLESYNLTTDHDILDGTQTGMICGGTVSLFFEYIGSADRVFIFGAGHIGRALVYHLRNLNYHITVIDDREEVLGELDGAHEKICSSFDTAFENSGIPDGSFVVISTYSHDIDYKALRRVYQSGWKPCYIGMIASHVKKELILDGMPADAKKNIDFDKLFSPCGLHIGGATPDEIAISVIAEMQAVRYGKSGHKHMKDKKKIKK